MSLLLSNAEDLVGGLSPFLGLDWQVVQEEPGQPDPLAHQQHERQGW